MIYLEKSVYTSSNKLFKKSSCNFIQQMNMFEILKINIYAFSLVGYLIWVVLVLNYKFCGFDIYWIIHNTRILYRRYNPNKEKKQSQNVLRNQKYHIHLQCTWSSDATFAG